MILSPELKKGVTTDSSQNGKFIMSIHERAEEATFDVPLSPIDTDPGIWQAEKDELFKLGVALTAVRLDIGSSFCCYIYLNKLVIPNPKVTITSIPPGRNQVPWEHLPTWNIEDDLRFRPIKLVSMSLQVNANLQVVGKAKPDNHLLEASVEFQPR